MEKKSQAEARKEALEEFADSELNKATLRNIYDWSCEGKTEKEIAKFMDLKQSEFKALKAKYPEVVGIMQKGTVYASTQLSLSMYELGIGGKVIHKQVVSKKTIYDENTGRRIREEPCVVTVSEQLPPNFYALQFLLKAKERVVYGDEKKEQKASENEQIISHMDEKELLAMKQSIMKDDLEIMKGKN